jgi:predicted heme/steroid binding protein
MKRKPMKRLPPIEMLQELLEYDPESGKLYWKVTCNGNALKGSEAGHKPANGYMKIKINGKVYQLQRIAYAIYHGADPYPYEIDHDDQDPTNNRITNLQLATRLQNNENRRPWGKVSHYGISITKHGKYKVVVKGKYLGCYDTLTEALTRRDEMLQIVTTP